MRTLLWLVVVYLFTDWGLNPSITLTILFYFILCCENLAEFLKLVLNL